MDSFSISQLEQFSGIKSHTIRIWEKRYNALQPDRSAGNTRYYNSIQLRRLLNIVSLMGGDYKVSALCTMSDKHLARLLEKKKDAAPDDELAGYFVAQLISAGINYDEQAFSALFSHCLLRYGIKDSYTRVIYPLLCQTGMMWACDSLAPAHEHFITNLIRQKLGTAIDLLPPPKQTEKWLLFLPENEFHECGLLLAHYLVRQAGKRVIYLGANVPTGSVLSAIESIKPDKLLLFIVHREQTVALQNYLNTISRAFRGNTCYVAATAGTAQGVKAAKKIAWLHDVPELERFL